MIKCPVCNNILNKVDNTYKCELNHSFDISKDNYTNLLLANQHHSLNPGDSKEMIKARKNFFLLDKYHVLKEKLFEIINSLDINDFKFCDIACGEGYYTNYIHCKIKKFKNINTVGVDISKYAVSEAGKKAKNIENINYFTGNLFNLPFTDNSYNVLLNCFAPIDDKEFSRVLMDKGYYIRVLPDKDHLYELKSILYKNVLLNEPKDENLEHFELVNKYQVKDIITLDSKEAINNLFMMTPYYYKSSFDSMNNLKMLDSLTTRISFIILLYRKK